MKVMIVSLVALLAGVALQAQTNASANAAESKGAPFNRGNAATPAPAPAAPAPRGGNARPNSPSPASEPRTSGNADVRSKVESLRLQRVTEALANQKPNRRDLETHRTTGLFPSFYRTVKTGGNPLQLINPFAPVAREEKDYSAVRSRVLDDPKTHAAPGIDVFSVSY